jgi:cell division protein FtsI/penicillin-binding protein 2
MFLTLCLLVIVGQLSWLQVYRGTEISNKARLQRQQNNPLIHRGSITDRHGLPLAIDTTRYDVFVHLDVLKATTQQATAILSQITQQDREHLQKLFSSGHTIVTVARCLNREQADQVQALNWAGVDIVPRAFRHYPEGTLAAHLLGYVNLDTRGQGGIEQSQDISLKDTGNVPHPQMDGRGKPILTHEAAPIMEITPPLGQQIELTIDNYLQHLVEKELGAMFYHSHAQRAAAIIMEPSTGEILAWANFPTYDPNEYTKYPYQATKNWSMVDVYQPGSTFKILTVSSGLDTGAIKPDSCFYDSGILQVGNRTIHNHDGGHGKVDLLHLLIFSSNVVAAQVGLTMTPQQFHDKLSEFKIGQHTGIDIPGESRGLLLAAKYWRPIDQATTGFGQGAVAVTPLQLISAVAAVANNGVWVQPHVIRRIYDPRTAVTDKWIEPKRQQVISPATAHLMCTLLKENIAMGTQIAGQVPGYEVAGKTGTAQKAIEGGRGYLAGQTVASFVGFLPADQPQFLCLVVVDGPQTDGRWGNTVAGPVFNAIAVEGARYLGIPPSSTVNLGTKTIAHHCARTSVPPSVLYAHELQHPKGEATSITATGKRQRSPMIAAHA